MILYIYSMPVRLEQRIVAMVTRSGERDSCSI